MDQTLNLDERAEKLMNLEMVQGLQRDSRLSQELVPEVGLDLWLELEVERLTGQKPSWGPKAGHHVEQVAG